MVRAPDQFACRPPLRTNLNRERAGLPFHPCRGASPAIRVGWSSPGGPKSTSVRSGSRTVRLGESISCPDCPRSLPNSRMGSSSRNPSREVGRAARSGSGLGRLVVQLGDQKRLRIRRHETAREAAGPQVYGRSVDERWTQGDDLEIVVQVLAEAAAERPAGHARAALAVVVDAPNVAPRRVRQEDVGPRLTVCAVP
jgi:hypothetical protein